jgi:hypothetical protein
VFRQLVVTVCSLGLVCGTAGALSQVQPVSKDEGGLLGVVSLRERLLSSRGS